MISEESVPMTNKAPKSMGNRLANELVYATTAAQLVFKSTIQTSLTRSRSRSQAMPAK